MAQLLTVIRRSTRIDLLHFLRGSGSSLLINKTTVLKCVESNKFVQYRQQFYSKSSEKQEEKSLQQQTQSDLSEHVKPITFKTVKETTKTASYLGVILLGVGIAGMIFYTVFSELFSSKSPNNVYSRALDQVINDTRIKDALGEPLSGFGEENRRGRRQHARYVLALHLTTLTFLHIYTLY